MVFFKVLKYRQISNFHKYIENKKGIEIGGPSKIFQADNLLPIYNQTTYLDNVNFNTNTIWEKDLKNEGDYIFPSSKKPGKQFVREAGDLSSIKNDTYDYLITSHFLEHTANPLKCLKEFNRILKPEGLVIVVVPYKNFTFDRNREFTTCPQ